GTWPGGEPCTRGTTTQGDGLAAVEAPRALPDGPARHRLLPRVQVPAHGRADHLVPGLQAVPGDHGQSVGGLRALRAPVHAGHLLHAAAEHARALAAADAHLVPDPDRARPAAERAAR